MQKALSILACTAIIGVAGSASALTFTEQFYGTATDTNYKYLGESRWVSLEFNLIDLNPAVYNPDPTLDAQGYDPLNMSVGSGILSFTFSSNDNELDNVSIFAEYFSGDNLLKTVGYDLGEATDGYWTYKEVTKYKYVWKNGRLIRVANGTKTVREYIPGPRTKEYATLDIDLFAEGFGGELQDGLFDAIVLSPYFKDGVYNDINLDMASLEVETVPEPTTMLIFGTGLLGLAAIGRKRRK